MVSLRQAGGNHYPIQSSRRCRPRPSAALHMHIIGTALTLRSPSHLFRMEHGIQRCSSRGSGVRWTERHPMVSVRFDVRSSTQEHYWFLHVGVPLCVTALVERG